MQDLPTIEHGPGGWTVQLPSDLADAEATEAQLRVAVSTVAAKGGGPLRLWVQGDGPSSLLELAPPAAERVGFRLDRTLHQLRRPLPVDELVVPTIPTRSFVPGQDDEAFLAVNNRAFAGHPEQGGWTAHDLQLRYDEPWFDPAGFLLHEVDGRLLGFCWTKVHADTTPPMGEIYAIAVDPAAHQQGLGKGLVVTGLDHLAHRGLRTGMLYVDAANAPATHLYARLGFGLHHEDRAFVLDVPAESPG
jgi:mycothiol synthase